MDHIKYLIESRKSLKTRDGITVKILDLNHNSSESVLSSWATHLREHYCPDSLIGELCQGTGLSRGDYLKQIKLPSKGHIKSGDFAEILLADYIEFVLEYIVPRTRYDARINRNMSSAGIDVMGFKLVRQDKISSSDELITCEVKAALQNKNSVTLTKALKDSCKDFNVRKAESLNAMKQRLKEQKNINQVRIVERYQNKADRPYLEVSTAAAVHSLHTWEDIVITEVNAKEHPNKRLTLLVVRGDSLMDLVNNLYERACHEA